MRAALAAAIGVDFVDDDRLDVAKSARDFSAVSKMYSDSGVVTSTCGGLRSMRARSTGVVSPVRVAVRIGASARPRSGRREQLAERRLEVLANVVGQRLERRDVDDERLVGQLAVGGAADQVVEADGEAASVLPEPVGAEISTSRPARISGQPWICGSVGSP